MKRTQKAHQEPQSPKGVTLKKIKTKLDLSNTQVGQVFVVGNGGGGQLGKSVINIGLGPDVLEKVRPTPLKYFHDKNIVNVIAGGMHNIAQSIEGKLYSWGCNDEGVLGRDTSIENSEFEPALVQGLENHKIVQVVCGDSISAALTEDGLYLI